MSIQTKIVCLRTKAKLIVQYAECGPNGSMKLIREPLKRFPLAKWKDAQKYTVERAKKEGYMFWLKWDFRKIGEE